MNKNVNILEDLLLEMYSRMIYIIPFPKIEILFLSARIPPSKLS